MKFSVGGLQRPLEVVCFTLKSDCAGGQKEGRVGEEEEYGITLTSCPWGVELLTTAVQGALLENQSSVSQALSVPCP